MKHPLALLLCLASATSCAQQSLHHLPVGERIDRMLSELVDDGEFAGAVLVARRGEVLLRRGYGPASIEEGIPNTPETTYQLASVSKLFTRQLVLRDVNEGLLALDDPLDRFFPGLQSIEGIRIRHLLNHTSGIPDAHNRDARLSEAAQAATPRTREEMLAIFQEEAPLFEPGTDQHYSSPGYSLLAYILEDLHGEPFAELLNEQIFAPLGMPHTTFGEGENVATPYWLQDEELEPAPPIECGHYIGSACVHSNVDDLHRWYRAVYRNGLLGEVATGKMALGAHHGHAWGSTTGFVPMPSEDTVVIVLSNYGHAPVQSIIPRIYTILFEPLVDELVPEQLDEYCGAYRVEFLGSMEHTTEVSRRGSRLVCRSEDAPGEVPAEIDLRPIGDDRFLMFAGGECIATVVTFERAATGTVSGLTIDSAGLVLHARAGP